MAVTDPVDARLLAALAETGKTAVHELAAKVGMDPKEVAYRLVGLSATGLPLLVGVESDPNGLRSALAGANPWPPRAAPQPPPAAPKPPGAGTPAGGHPPSRSAPPQSPPQRPTHPPADPIVSTWGPPQTAMWARSDPGFGAGSAAPRPAATTGFGRTGDVGEPEGLEGGSAPVA